MSTEATPPTTSTLYTDDLKGLREGDIYTDEYGKKFRVKKSMMSHHFIGGPHGIGDPEDRSLRRIEADVLIPNRMNAHIEKNDCKVMYENLVQCLRREGGAVGLYKCVPERDELNECKTSKFLDPKFRQEITEAYLNERAEVRRTGMTAKQRKLQEYREWKKANPEGSKDTS